MAKRILTTISSIKRNKNPFELPAKYEFLKVMGHGGFGVVLKCAKKDTKDTVAIKIPKRHNTTDIKECFMLRHLMDHNLDKYNIVKFYESFDVADGRALVFESLDISLDDYIYYYHPLCLNKIRAIIQQLATAFEALKGIGIIHTDVKPDNIMVVNRWTHPLSVKLIDFGLAMPSSESRAGMRLQTVYFRAPEIILGLPFSESIDMWSLGGVLATMILGYVLFPGKDEYEALRFITDLLGQPSDDLLRNGKKTNSYFKQTDTDGWRLMTPEEYWGESTQPHVDHRRYRFHSLDYLKQIRREDESDEASEREKCTELLKAMLRIDEAERITPSEVLSHPFIARDCSNSCNEGSEAAAAPPSQTESEAPTEKTTPDESSTRGSLSSSSPQRPLTPIQPQPAPATGSWELDGGQDGQQSAISEHPDGGPPALAPKDDVINIHPDPPSCSPKMSRTIVIMVRPATAENTVTLESQESDISSQSGMSGSLLGVSDSDMSWLSDDSSTSDDSETTEEEEEEEEEEEDGEKEEEDKEKKKRKKKKKNCFRRFFSWMKKNLCCWTCVEDDG